MKCLETYPNSDGLFEQVTQNIGQDGGNSAPASPYFECGLVVIDKDLPVARLAIYTNPNISYNGVKTAIIGCFESLNEDRVARCLFDGLSDYCKSHDIQYVIGPMEGSTWENYRFFESFDQPIFITECAHPEYYAELFQKNGFNPIANYVSRLERETIIEKNKFQEDKARFKARGIDIRYMDLNNLNAELIDIAKFCNKAFRKNFLFSPIEPDYFRDKYLQIKNLIRPEFALIAEFKNEIVGLAFGIADEQNDLFIVKTLAKLDMEVTLGLGFHLVDKLVVNAREAGYKKIIHAFMINDNRSINISDKRRSTIFREYALYGREI